MRPRPILSALTECAPLVPVFAAYAALARIHPELGAAPLVYAGYFIAFLLLPSIALSRLLPFRDLGVMERAVLGFPVTLAALFLLAWGGSRGTGFWWLAYLLPAMGLYAVLDLLLSKQRRQCSDPVSLAGLTAVLSVSLLLCFSYFTYVPIYDAGPVRAGLGDDGALTAVTFSIIKAMLTGAHAQEACFQGIPYVYHILMNISGGVAYLVTRIHPIFIQIYLYPIFHWLMLAGAVIVGARRIAQCSPLETAVATILLLFVTGHTFDSMATLQMFSTFHTYFFGLPATIILGMLIFGYLNGRLGKLPVLYSAATFMTVSSAKGVPLLLVPLSLLPVLAYRLVKRKVAKEELFFAASSCVVAVILKLIEYDDPRVVVMRKFHLFNSVMPVFNTLVDVAPFLFVFVLMLACRRYYGQFFKANAQYIVFVLAMYLISITLPRIINFTGGDQYFFWYTRVFFFIFCASILSVALRSHATGIRCAAVAAIGVFVLLFAVHRYDQHVLVSSKKDPKALTRLEWDGLMWAHDNLGIHSRAISNGSYAFLVVNRPVIGVQRNGMIDHYALSGLYSYACPQDFVDSTYRAATDERITNMVSFFEASTVEERLSWMKRMDVDYVFYCKRWPRGANFSLPPEYTVVYSNPDFEIYKVPSSGS